VHDERTNGDETMTAVRLSRLGGPEVLEIVDLPVPSPGPGEILIRAHSIGVGKYDMLARTGRYPFVVELPAILGIEMSGTVAALGDGVDDLAIGDGVYLMRGERGCYAEYTVCRRAEVTVLGGRIDLDAAVAISNYMHAWAMLYDAADARRVRYAYMNGAAGGIGMAMCQLCRIAGIELIAATSSDRKCDFARQQGASHAVNTTDETDLAARVMELTDGHGVDLMFDQLVGPDFRDNLALMAPLGQIVTINALHGTPSSDLFADLRANMVKSVSVRAFSSHVYRTMPGRLAEIIDEVLAIHATGALQPAITEEYALTDVVRAHEVLDAGQVLGKMVLRP
jgi:NADPH2:quinone reductase